MLFNGILWAGIIVGTIGLAIVEGPGVIVIVAAILCVGAIPRVGEYVRARKVKK